VISPTVPHITSVVCQWKYLNKYFRLLYFFMSLEFFTRVTHSFSGVSTEIYNSGKINVIGSLYIKRNIVSRSSNISTSSTVLIA